MTSHDRHYADMADRIEGRDHDVRVAYGQRLTLSEGATGRAWLKFHPQETLIWVTTPEGKPAWLTRTQARVYGVLPFDRPTTMRAIAAVAGVAPSTVSRAAVKLQSLGFIGYISARGRYAGTIIVRRAKGDGLDRLRELAKAKVRAWAKAAERRLARTKINVASLFTEKEWRDHGYHHMANVHMNATLKRPWTVEELREAGII
jgi:DNA-binding IclR family transcriptional regulator